MKMLNIIIKQAEENMESALNYAKRISGNKDKTDILNAQYYMGRFSSCMDLLEIISLEKYVEIGEKTSMASNMILTAIDKLYR